MLVEVGRRYRFQRTRPMPRQPKLRKNKIGGNTSWFTEAGLPTYFGNIDEDARRAFRTHVDTLADESKDRKRAGQSAGRPGAGGGITR